MACSITVKNLTLKRGKSTLIHDLSLNVSHKEKLALIGDNGCGKSTFLKTLIGLHKDYSGMIEVMHKPLVDEKDFKNARQIIGFLPQESDDFFIAPTVVEDVAFGLVCRGTEQKSATQKARTTLEDLGIAHLENRSVFELSGGEKKIVALAGILSFEPQILLLDEPTNGLDRKSIERVVEILKGIDKSMIIVSHDTQFLQDIAHHVCDLSKNIIS